MSENVKEMIAEMGLPDFDPPWESKPQEIQGKINVFGFQEAVKISAVREMRGTRMAQVEPLDFLTGVKLFVPVESVEDLRIVY